MKCWEMGSAMYQAHVNEFVQVKNENPFTRQQRSLQPMRGIIEQYQVQLWMFYYLYFREKMKKAVFITRKLKALSSLQSLSRLK